MTTETSTGTDTRGGEGSPLLRLGTMYFGTTVPAERADAILDAAHDLGVRHLDTANNYAFWVPGGEGGESEECIGRWLARSPGRRDSLHLATKIGALPADGDHPSSVVGLAPDRIREQTRESLRRLRTDHVDLLYAHIDDRSVPLADVIGTLQELRAEGLTRAIGSSNLTAPRLREAVDLGGTEGYGTLQQRFTYLRPAAEADLGPHVLLDEEVEEIGTRAGLDLVGYSPLLSGAYTDPAKPLPQGYDTARNRAALAVLERVAGQAGLDQGQTVLAWMMRRRARVLPVVGVSSVSQLRSAVSAAGCSLDPAALEALDDARMTA